MDEPKKMNVFEQLAYAKQAFGEIQMIAAQPGAGPRALEMGQIATTAMAILALPPTPFSPPEQSAK